jgi:hypothetical protein
MDTPVDVLRRWEEHGAHWRVVSLTEKHAVVELCSCLGEPVDRLESDDPELLLMLRQHSPA